MKEAPTTVYSLPPLPFAYDALEPWCSTETLELHHDKHHAAYVTEANAAVPSVSVAS